jgi:hypothetical protein
MLRVPHPNPKERLMSAYPQRRPARKLILATAAILAFSMVPTMALAEAASASTVQTASVKLLTSTPTPTISGTVAVGQTLHAVPGIWGPGTVKLNYRWKRNGASISGATKSTYKVTKTDAGRKISVSVRGSRSGYKPVTRTSASTTAKKVLTKTAVPSISGGARVGQTLSAVPGTWLPAPVTLKYQWVSNGTAIAGATAATLTLSVGQVGTSIGVTVTGSKAGYLTRSFSSPGTSAVLGATQLNAGDTLYPGQYLQSPNAQYMLVMQGDGNLVEYGGGNAIWSTGTSGSNFLAMQSDGNLVVYHSGGGAVWSTYTNVGSGGVAALQDDGNFVLYQGATPLWSRAVVGFGTVKASGGTQGMSDATLNSTQRAAYPYGKTLGLVCYKYGETVNGAFGSGNLWHQLIDGNYVADVDLETGVNGPVAGEPQCGGGGNTSSLDAFVAKYNGQSNVANAAGTYPGQCVSLISQYLLQVYGITTGAWGNAVDYQAGGSGGNQMQSRGFVWHGDQSFQNGDIIVYGASASAGTGSAGHIAIWYNGKLFDQNDGRGTRSFNQNTQTYSVGFASFFSGGYIGYWRHG